MNSEDTPLGFLHYNWLKTIPVIFDKETVGLFTFYKDPKTGEIHCEDQWKPDFRELILHDNDKLRLSEINMDVDVVNAWMVE